MSNSIDNDLDLDLHFLPSWAKEPSNRNLYADFAGESEDRPGRYGDRPPRRREGGPPPRDRQGPRPEGERRGFPPRRPGDDRGRGGPSLDRRPPPREARPAPPETLPDIRLVFLPDEKGVDSLARQIRMTGRAYPLFGVAQMILAKPERHLVSFSVIKGANGQVLQPLYVCAVDDTLWLSEQDAINYVLDKHFGMFYQAEKTAIEPPKGTYTFVAQCGMSGAILGPPNHHDYQNQLHRLHAERFARMPFDVFKARVKIVRDEAVIKKWLDEQSWRTEYVCLNMPEPLRLGTIEEVQKHFRENHLPIIIKQTETHTLSGTASRSLRSGPLLRLVRAAWEDQKRFPLQVSTVLSNQFASRGLQFFKVNKNVTHVAVARPHYLDLEAIPISEGVKRIVTFILDHPRCSRRQLIDALIPAGTVIPVLAPAPVSPAPEVSAEAPTAPEASAPAATPTPAGPSTAPSAEATAMISDLHWLIHQGHVIEFADGLLELAKKPLPKPVKPRAQVPPPTPQAGSVPASAEQADAVPTPAETTAPALEVAEETAVTTPSPAVEPVPAAPVVEAPAINPETPIVPAQS